MGIDAALSVVVGPLRLRWFAPKACQRTETSRWPFYAVEMLRRRRVMHVMHVMHVIRRIRFIRFINAILLIRLILLILLGFTHTDVHPPLQLSRPAARLR